MQATTTRSGIPSTTATADLVRVRDRELRDLVDELEDTYDDLVGRALKDGDPTVYGLAQVVRTAADYLINLRLAEAR